MVTSKNTPGIKPRRNADGSTSFDAQLSIKGFPRIQRTYPTRDEAVEWRAKTILELRKQREGGGARPELATLTVGDLNRLYLADPETLLLADHADRARQLARWSALCGSTRVLDFGVMQARAARDALVPGRANATVVRYIAAQRAAWNWGRAAGLVPNERPWPPKLALTEPEARVRYLSDDELVAVLKAAADSSATMYAAVTLAIATGVRQGEMLRLTWADIDLPRSTIRLLLTKARIPRSVYLPASAAEALHAIKGDAKAQERVFLYRDGTPLDQDRLIHEWEKVRSAAALSNFRWHDLRHSCASLLAQNGSTLLEIGSVLGHKRAQTTLKYSHLIEGKAVTGSAALDAKLRLSSKA